MAHNQFREDAPFYDITRCSPRYPPPGARLPEDPQELLPAELEGCPATRGHQSTPPKRFAVPMNGKNPTSTANNSKTSPSSSERSPALAVRRLRAADPWTPPIDSTTLVQRFSWPETGILSPKPIRPNLFPGVVERFESAALSPSYEDIERINQSVRIEKLEAENKQLRFINEGLKDSVRELCIESLTRPRPTRQEHLAPVQAAGNPKFPKKMTYDEFNKEVRTSVDWMEEDLGWITKGEGYVRQEKRCKVGRPTGKVLRKVDDDDFGNCVCNQHRKGPFLDWKMSHPNDNPWVCPAGRAIMSDV
ncbi:hypothetical protein K491DRAFT_675482 [Lophiostoma macrostomum CBS 122681]|uniref:Uncharacterized protein n=1 Tax=Lophiostoma macrostomum CBS 122681 TaxID=1314788 RepID=A0A6A6THJ7_9PLEO|nr:hypothetical protein K491DRAFT_675482 [Lophiostoma macrostomum CBS 122681]